MELNVNYKYYAFISYSHEDEEFAKRIQKKLTEYKLPSVIRKANPLLPDNVRPIFRDVTNLTTGMLQGKLNSELEHSKFLIVLCSPNSAKPNDENKHWVNNEVQHFIDIGRTEYIIPVIIGGEPHAKNLEAECFCPALLSLPGGDELLGIDIRKKTKKKISFGKTLKRKLGIPDEDDLEEKGIVHIVAKMLGLNIDDLWDWNKKAQKRKAYTKLFIAAACFVVILSAGLTIYFKKIHVYHEYYVDYVEQWFLPKGIHKLKKNEIKIRNCCYRIDIRDNKIIACCLIGSDNKIKKNTTLGEINKNQNSVLLKYEYKKSSIPVKVTQYDSQKSLICEYDIVNNGENVFQINFSKKSEYQSSLDLQGESVIFGKTISKISSELDTLNKDGFCIRKIYYRYHDDFDEDNIGFMPDNTCGSEYVLDELGRIKTELFLGLDENNQFIYTENYMGVAGYNNEYLNTGEQYKLTAFDINRKLVKSNDISTKIEYFYDEVGKLYLEEFYSVDSFIGAISYGYYQNGNLESKSLLNTNKKSYFKIKYTYDKNHNITSQSYYDENEGSIMGTEKFGDDKIGFISLTGGSFIYKYDSNDNISEVTVYDIDNQPILIDSDPNSKIYVLRMKYDNNNIVERSFHDYEGDYINYLNSFAIVRYDYNNKDEVIEEKYFDKNENLTCNLKGYAISKYEYKKGNKIVDRFYNEKGENSLYNNKYHCLKRKYNDKGQMIERVAYDINDIVVDYYETGFIPITKYTYDSFGRPVSEKWYDKNNKYIKGFRGKFDKEGRLLVAEIINEKDELIIGDDGYAKKVIEYDSKECIFEGYYDVNSQLVNCFIDNYLYAYVIYDSENNYEANYYNKNGKKIELHNYAIINGIFQNNQIDNLRISENDILLKWNNWEYKPDNPNYDFFMKEYSITQNTNKHIVFYNPKEDFIYSYDFGPGDVGINVVGRNLILANFDETFSLYRKNKKNLH